MKRLIALPAMISLIFTLCLSCASVDSASLIGEWKLRSYANLFTSSLSRTEVAPEENYVLRFDKTGIFSFTTDCNSISGQYKVTGDNMEFINPFATEMACDSEIVERSIKSDIANISSFKLVGDSMLSLVDDRENVLIELVRIESE